MNDSDYSFLSLFAAVPDELPSHEQQPLPDSSWFVVDEQTPLQHALCRPIAHASRAPPRNDIDGHGDRADHGGTAVMAVLRAAVAAGSLTPDGRAGLPGTASRLRPAGWLPLARRIARQCLPPVGRRRPARVEQRLS